MQEGYLLAKWEGADLLAVALKLEALIATVESRDSHDSLLDAGVRLGTYVVLLR